MFILLGDVAATVFVAQLSADCCATVAQQLRYSRADIIAELLPDCSATVAQQLGDNVGRLLSNLYFTELFT